MSNTKLIVLTVLVQVLAINFVCPSTAKSATSSAEKMLALMPDDVAVFMATSGDDELKASLEKAILGRIWNDPGTQTFYQSIKQELLSKIRQEMSDPNEAKAFDAITDFVKISLKRPIVIGVARKADQTTPPIYGFAILDAGVHKSEIVSALTKLEALAHKGDIIDVDVGSFKMHGPVDQNAPLYWGWVKNYLIIAINEKEGLALKSLSKSPVVSPDYFKDVPPTNDALALYIDFQKIGSVVKAAPTKQADIEELNKVTNVIKELGLANVETLAARMGFDGADIVSNSFLQVPEPRTGMLQGIKTIDLSMFDMVDARATGASAFNYDFGRIYDIVMGAIKITAPNDEYLKIQQSIADFESKTNLSIRRGLLESIEGVVVFYDMPSGVIMELLQGGLVMVAKLKNEAQLEKNLDALCKYVADNSNGKIEIRTQVQSDGRTLHTCVMAEMAMMQVMPCWTIVDKQLVIASNPALSNSAVKLITSPSPVINSIRSTDEFKKVTKNLPENLTFLKYADSRVQFQQMMMGIQQFWPMVTMAAAQGGIKLPFVLPSLTHIAKDMGPSCEYCWLDDNGFGSHYRGVGIEQSLGAIAGGSMAVGITMPALAKARQLARRAVSGTNLSAIGKACLIYANDHDGNYPDRLEELVEKTDLTSKCLVSPFKPKDSAEPSYIYIPGQNVEMNPQNIIAYDNPQFCTDGVNTLFNDGLVKWMERAEFLKELEATYKRLGREMPEVIFKGQRQPVPAEETQPSPVSVEK